MITIELFKLFGSIFVDSDAAENSIAKTDKKAGTMGETLGKGIKTAGKWGLAIGAAAGGAALAVGALAKPLVESAAKASAMNAQFEQVFGDMQKSAQSTVEGLGKDFGMLPNRIKPSLTQMTSMFKGLGMDTEEAMSTAEEAVTLTADAAAFYDKSFEDANSALNSFIKGNYEGGESIGLFANETQLAAYASDKLGKDWKTLDEAGKQVTRLEYAKAMQESAGATGQASRESNSLENQLGNLKQAWEDIKVKFGAPILEPAVAMIGGLASKISDFDVQPLVDKFTGMISYVQDTWIPKFQNAFETIGALYESFMSVFNDTGDVTDILAKVGIGPEKAAQIESFFNVAIEGFNTFRDLASAAMDKVKNAVKMLYDNLNIVLPIIAGVTGAIVAQMIINSLVGAYKAWQAATVTQTTAQWLLNAALNANPLGIVALAIGAVIAIGILLWKNWDTIKEKAGQLWSFLTTKFSEIKEVVVNKVKELATQALAFFVSLYTGTMEKFNALKAGASAAVSALRTVVVNKIEEIRSNTINKITAMKNSVTGKFDEVRSAAVTKFNAVKDAITRPVFAARDAIKGAVDRIKGFFSGMSLKLPNIKTPHFKLKNWSINPVDWIGNMPSIGIDWYKDGGVFSKPTLFNTASGLKGVGEAGPEAVLPLNDRVLGAIGKSIAATMGTGGQQITITPAPIYFDGQKIAELTFDATDRLFGASSTQGAWLQGVKG